MPIEAVFDRLAWCANQRLYAVRFSGGEPTVYKDLDKVVAKARHYGIEKVALSTNGSAEPDYYRRLWDVGVNDFSISLDACCSSTGDTMSGTKGKWQRVIDNIKMLSKLTYVTAGIVLTDENSKEAFKTIQLAHDLGAMDIRIIPAAQCGRVLGLAESPIPPGHPILSYRMKRMSECKSVRGLSESDNDRCPLIHDDVIFAGDHHYPCIIHFRERGSPIGRFEGDIRRDRSNYACTHDTHKDSICRRNCLDVCTEYNNAWREKKEYALPRGSADSFEGRMTLKERAIVAWKELSAVQFQKSTTDADEIEVIEHHLRVAAAESATTERDRILKLPEIATTYEAIEDAVKREWERCAKAICSYCDESGIYGVSKWDGFGWFHTDASGKSIECKARKIRKGIE